MKKILKHGLLVLALVAIVLILWIKTDLPKIPNISFLTHNSAEAFNDIILNLSYGYLSGIIIYWLTAYRPLLKRNKLIMKSANFIVLNFTKNVVRDFLAFYWGNKEEECENIYQFAEKMGDKYIFSIRLERIKMPPDTQINDSFYRKKLRIAFELRNEFRKEISPYIPFLNENQLSILNEVILNELENMIKEPNEDVISGSTSVIINKMREKKKNPKTLYINGFPLYKEYVMNVLKLNDCIVPKEIDNQKSNQTEKPKG